MHRDDPPSPALRPRHELDAAVANLELTIISIVQGVALYFLADSARTLISELHFSALPYLASSLLIIFTVWSRSAIHSFTVIRWPLELGHNFGYIGVTLVEAALFAQCGSPRTWYPMSVLLGAVFWLMFVYERRMYRLRMRDSAGPVGAELLRVLERDHHLSMVALVPASLVLWSVSAVLVWRYPALFLDGGWHVALGTLQALGLLGYLAFVLRFYRGISDSILAARTEWEAER